MDTGQSAPVQCICSYDIGAGATAKGPNNGELMQSDSSNRLRGIIGVIFKQKYVVLLCKCYAVLILFI